MDSDDRSLVACVLAVFAAAVLLCLIAVQGNNFATREHQQTKRLLIEACADAGDPGDISACVDAFSD